MMFSNQTSQVFFKHKFPLSIHVLFHVFSANLSRCDIPPSLRFLFHKKLADFFDKISPYTATNFKINHQKFSPAKLICFTLRNRLLVSFSFPRKSQFPPQIFRFSFKISVNSKILHHYSHIWINSTRFQYLKYFFHILNKRN